MRCYCKYCGYQGASISSLTAFSCRNSPNGKHVLYEGGELSRYHCKYCGYQAASISSLTAFSCRNSPNGKHEPAIQVSPDGSERGGRSWTSTAGPIGTTMLPAGCTLFFVAVGIVLGTILVIWSHFSRPGNAKSFHTTPAPITEVQDSSASAPDSPAPSDPARIEVRRALPATGDLPALKSFNDPSSQQALPPLYVVVGIGSGDSLNVRSTPSASSRPLFQLTNGQEVQIEGEPVSNGVTEWIRIKVGMQEGWVNSTFLQSKSE